MPPPDKSRQNARRVTKRAKSARQEKSGTVGEASLPLISPDIIEETLGEQIDNGVPSQGYKMMPMIGLGGSAGSIRALQSFFQKMPADTGMVFVVVLHLSPEHESSLAELLQRSTTMRVVQAEESQKVLPDCVYVIPPGKHIVSVDGQLRLTPLQPERGKRITVDLFFRTLADTHGPHSAAVILSGADGDGALGIKRIKERGGLTVAQDPAEAEHPDMPRSAIATGMIDWILPVADMPRRLLEYRRNEKRLRVPPEDGPHPADSSPKTLTDGEEALRQVLTFLRTQTGHDFSYYKRATIVRRISRRMQVNAITELEDYLVFVRTHPGEARALLQDLLISVTNFFRDRDAFAALEGLVPELFKNKSARDTVRVWVPACATGEEAYSVAILLSEYARKLPASPALQVFATDLDDNAIAIAREAVFPGTISADVSAERLRQFFIKDALGYRVRREVRELLLFASHDLLRDSPFSRLDLISCRNLLIYLNREAQTQAAEIFHFALLPGGKLFLGSSESVDDPNELFRVIDKKHRLYASLATGRRRAPLPLVGTSTLARYLRVLEKAEQGPIVAGEAFGDGLAIQSAPLRRDSEGVASRSDLHFGMIQQFAPPSLIVNGRHDIVHLSETVSQFLQFSPGEPTNNLLRVVHPMLRVELRAALFRAGQTGEPVDAFQVPLEREGQRSVVDLHVIPAGEKAPDFFLVVFEPAKTANLGPNAEKVPDPEPAVHHLEQELEQVKGNMRNLVEQYEVNTEELKASNEELQAMNEELRSATEELETSREELQSINEELTTVNVELKSKVDELAHANSDLHNLMGATAISTIFLDRNLNIMRYTQAATKIFHLIDSDVGRPLSDLKHTLDYPTLARDVDRVLHHPTLVERETTANDGRCYIARLLPYRTTDDRIAGVVLTFVDISERVQAQKELQEANGNLEQRVVQRTQELQESNQTLETLVNASPLAIITVSPQGLVRRWNRAAERMFGWTAKEVVGRTVPGFSDRQPQTRPSAARSAKRAEKSESRQETQRPRKDGTWIDVSIWSADIVDQNGKLLVTMTIVADITERKSLERALLDATEREQRRIGQDLHDGLCQVLFGLALKTKTLAAHLPPRNRAETTQLAQLLSRAIEQVGAIVHGLHPAALRSGGLANALKELCESIRDEIVCQVRCSSAVSVENREQSLHLYRIAQEAVHNAARHSQAKKILISLKATKRSIVLEVRDDGSGFDTSKADGVRGIGLASMNYRASAMGATLSITSSRKTGTCVRCVLPFSGPAGPKARTIRGRAGRAGRLAVRGDFGQSGRNDPQNARRKT